MGKFHSVGDVTFDMAAILKTDPAFRPLTEAELDALVEAELAKDPIEMPDFDLILGSMGDMEGMEPFPNQQPIPPVVDPVPEDAAVVKAVLVAPTYQSSNWVFFGGF